MMLIDDEDNHIRSPSPTSEEADGSDDEGQLGDDDFEHQLRRRRKRRRTRRNSDSSSENSTEASEVEQVIIRHRNHQA